MATLKEAGWAIHVHPVSGSLIIHRDADPIEIRVTESGGFYRVRLSVADEEDQAIHGRVPRQR